MSNTNSQRMGTMDDIRVVLTLMGIVLHAALQTAQIRRGLDTFNIWMWVDGSIHIFRMQIFFVISGYFSWKAITKSDYIQKRTRQLLLPGIVSWFVICSLIRGHIQILHPTEGIDFYNVWFIFTLYLLVVGNWILYRLGLLPKIIAFAQNNTLVCLVSAVMLQLLINAARSYVDAHFAWTFHFGIPQVMSLTVDYEFYFLGGLILGQTNRWKEILRHSSWGPIGLVVWLGWLGATYISPSIVNNIFVATLVTVMICLGIMSVGTTSTVRIKGASKLCSASLSIYLWHFPFIVLFHTLVRDQGMMLSDTLMFVGLCGSGLVGSLLVYQLIIKSEVLRWLWLGEARPQFKLTLPFIQEDRTIA